MKRILGLLALTVAGSALAAPAANMQEGEGNLHQNDHAGHTDANAGHQRKICVTKQDIAEGRKTLPQASDKRTSARCSTRTCPETPSATRWSAVASRNDHDRVDHLFRHLVLGKSKVEMSGGPHGNMVMEQDYAARRVGEREK